VCWNAQSLTSVWSLKGDPRTRRWRQAHLPTILASGLLGQTVAVPWWNGVRYP